MSNTLNWETILSIATAITPFAAGFFIFLHKLDKKVSVLQNDIDWIKLKTTQRRNADHTTFIDKV